MGFRQAAEPSGCEVSVVPVDVALQREISYDAFMLQHDFSGAFLLGFSGRTVDEGPEDQPHPGSAL